MDINDIYIEKNKNTSKEDVKNYELIQREKEKEAHEEEIKEKIKASPVIQEEFKKAYYRDAIIDYAYNDSKANFKHKQNKSIIMMVSCMILTIIENIITCVASKTWAISTIFVVTFLIGAIMLLIKVIILKPQLNIKTLNKLQIYQPQDYKYGLYQFNKKIKHFYWLYALSLTLVGLLDICLTGVRIDKIHFGYVISQLALIVILFILFGFYTVNNNELFANYTLVIAKGKDFETGITKDTVLDQTNDYFYDYFEFMAFPDSHLINIKKVE